MSEMKSICRLDHYKNHNDSDNQVHENEKDADDGEEPEDELFPRFHKVNLPCKDKTYFDPFPIVGSFQYSGIDTKSLSDLIERGGKDNYTD